jgi:hypothetical protein
MQQEVNQLEDVRKALELKVKRKIGEVIDSLEKSGKTQKKRSYHTQLVIDGRKLEVTIKDGSDMKYMRTLPAESQRDERYTYLISHYSRANATDLIQAVKIIKALAEKLEAEKKTDDEKIAEAAKEIEEL